MFRRTAVLLAVLMILSGCGDDGEGGESSVTTPTNAPEASTMSTVAAAEEDPYEAYLTLNPEGEEPLSREDAQARAYLGCGQEWAPGTVDRALADAYRPFGTCD